MKTAKKAAAKSIAGKRILFPVARIDVDATQQRVLNLAATLAGEGAHIDVMSHHEETVERANKLLAKFETVRVIHNTSKQVYWTPQRRDDIVRAFIKDNMNLRIPGTDLPYWKSAAFDDFRGHVSAHTFDPLSKDYDLLMVPIPSMDESPALEADVLLSNCIFHAKEYGIPMLGLQIYPALQSPRIYYRLLNHILVRSDAEADVYRRAGVPAARVHILRDPRDIYCLATIEDVYKNLMFDDRIKVAKNELFIMITNHSRYRAQIIEALKAIGKLPFPTVVCFVKVQFEVRDLHEDQIFDELIKPHLDKLGKYYMGEITAIGKLSMLCDVSITTTYVTPLLFAAQYGKEAIVYNPIRAHAGHQDGIQFVTREDDLRRRLTDEYTRKQARNTLVDIVAEIVS